MTTWVCIRSSTHCRIGQYFVGESGEELIPGRLKQIGKHRWSFEQTSVVGTPFHLISDHLMPVGFHVPEFTPKDKTIGALEQKEIVDFKEYTEDIFEPDNLERNIKANPSLTPKGGSGIVVPGNFKKEEE